MSSKVVPEKTQKTEEGTPEKGSDNIAEDTESLGKKQVNPRHLSRLF